MNIWKYLFLALFVPCFLTYIIQHLIVAFFFKTQNLKKRYNAEWALVTGASSGACIQLQQQLCSGVLLSCACGVDLQALASPSRTS